MKKITWVVACVALLGSVSLHAGEWKPIQQATVTTLLVADWAQTRNIARRDDLIEMNPIMGEHPTISEVNQYFALCALAYNLAAYHLPDEWANRLSIMVGVIQVQAVGNNIRLGVKFDF